MPFTSPIRPTTLNAEAILTFWFYDAKPYQWYRRDLTFDQIIRDRFGALHMAARRGKLDVWRTHPRHALSLVILLDQFSRNIFRDNARAFEQDDLALDAARDAIKRRFDKLCAPRERAFFYMPFMHCEDLTAQEASLRLFADSGNMRHAREHHDIIKRFGRFPHRNKLLGRASTPAEIAFLKAGGFNP
jgi:uncharacterized protein (DUF924 family)